MRDVKPIIAIVGPTASGKSVLGIELALRFGGEIINCDSVQVYREIEIATAKVPAAERRGVPHHLIDFVPPERPYTAADWARDALQVIAQVESRGNMASIVGGTGFYLRALRQPLFYAPPTDENVRSRVRAIMEQRGSDHLYRMLQRLDRASALQIHPNDRSRVQRALEVRFQTGRPLSEQKLVRPPAIPPADRVRILALLPPRGELYRRIDERTEAHFNAGLVDEVRKLLEKGVPADSTALGAHGYRRVVEYLAGRRATLESAIEQTRLDVRHYAKRQLTWFRREPGVEWFSGFGDELSTRRIVEARVSELLALEARGTSPPHVQL